MEFNEEQYDPMTEALLRKIDKKKCVYCEWPLICQSCEVEDEDDYVWDKR